MTGETEETRTEQIELYRCTECGELSTSIGRLHSHIETHRGFTRFNIQLPLTRSAPANVEELEKRTEIIRVTDFEVVEPDHAYKYPEKRWHKQLEELQEEHDV